MNKILIALISIVIIAGIGFGIYTVTSNNSNESSSNISDTPNSTSSPSAGGNNTSEEPAGAIITSAELAKNNGKNGADCWVAINGKVYDVTGSNEWVNGSHTPSNGQAQCGQDESSVIGSSPHGSSVLSSLPVVGSLAN